MKKKSVSGKSDAAGVQVVVPPVQATGSGARKRSGPTTTPATREGASIGRSARSRAGGAAGQLTPKD